MKSALKKTIGSRCLTKADLEATLFEVEACLNSKPLTFVGDEVDSIVPLTPSHFLVGRNLCARVENSRSQEAAATSEELREMSQFGLLRIESFWQRWSKDYLRNLPTLHCGRPSEVKTDTVVVLQEDNLPRLRWKLGRIVEVLPGQDGIVRCVRIKTATGELVRPLQRLHELEVSDVSCLPELPDVSESLSPEVPEAPCKKTRSGRSVRAPNRLDV
jgi:hypothetical protein